MPHLRSGPTEIGAPRGESHSRQAHWQAAYAGKGEREVSWFQDSAQPSLALIEAVGAATLSVIDIGGGASRLVDGLLQRGFRDVTVLDLSMAAVAATQTRLGEAAQDVHWIVEDVTRWRPARAYDLWHDRATFHFLTAEHDRAAYCARLAQALEPGGHVVIATFAPDGPERCSGLPVMRYDAASLGRVLGPSFSLVSTRRHEHMTPWGTRQAFQFSVFRHQPDRRGY